MITARDLEAHWQRIWLRAPGYEDAATQVHWMQSGALYADIRIPSDRPALNNARALSDLSADQLLSLMQAEGFAGIIDVQDSICTWTREINWHGTPDSIDAGRMSFDSAGDLIEDGVHADYAELWRATPERPTAAYRFVAGEAGQGILVLSNTRFLIGLGRPDAPATAPLIAALEAGGIPSGLHAHFAAHYVFGEWEGSAGQAQLATNPFLEGQVVLTRSSAGFQFTGVTFDGQNQVLEIPVRSIPNGSNSRR